MATDYGVFVWPASSNLSVSGNNLPIPNYSTLVGGSDGTNLVPLKVDATGALNINATGGGIVDAGNSTTTPLAGGGVFTGAAKDITGFGTVSVLVASDVAAASGGFSFQFSSDGTNWDHAHNFDFAGGNLSYNISAESKYFRIVYTNGASAQAYFRLQTVLRPQYVQPSQYAVSQTITDSQLAILTKNVIYGKTTGGGGGYVSVKVNPSGALTSEVSGAVQILDSSNSPITATSGALDVNIKNSPSLLVSQYGTWNVGISGRLISNASAYNDYSSVNVTTAAYVELVASTTLTTNEIEIFDSSGQGMILATGAAGAEVDQIFIFPGGNGRVALRIPVSTRVSIKAKTGTANVGYIMLNFYA